MAHSSHTIALVIGTSGAGGAERVLATLANAWAERGWNVFVLTFETPGATSFYPFHPAVHFQPLGEKRPAGDLGLAWGVLRLLRRLQMELKRIQPHVIVSFIDRANILTLLAARRLPFPVIVSEHTDPRLNLKIETANWRFWEFLRRLTYPRAARVVVLSPEARQGLPQAIWPQCSIIPNPVLVAANSAPPQRAEREPRVISAGRLGPQKQFNLLIQAFAKIAARHPEWSLWIYGEGEDRLQLEELSRILKIEDRVHLPGLSNRLFDEFYRGKIFAVTSRYEPFGMALAEAMSCGMPAVSFDLPGGPRQIVRHEIDGLLVPAGDAPAFAAALERLMDNEHLRQRLAGRAVEAAERFGLPQILARWDDLFAQIAPNSFPPSMRSAKDPG